MSCNERVLDALADGMPRAEAMRVFQVSRGSIKRCLRAHAKGTT